MTFIESARRMGYEIAGSSTRDVSGAVYRATDIGTGRQVAIKALNQGFDLERLERDAKILAEIDHPNVASIRAFDTIDGAPSVVADWIDGEPLSRLLGRHHQLSTRRALDIFEQVTAALETAHRAGVIHRNVSPASVLVGPGDQVSVIDFGLSQGTETATVTVDGMVDGAPRFLAPEVIDGMPATPRSDQYAAAVMLHEMLTGRWPYPETESVAGALHHHRHSTPTPLDEINPLLGAGLTDAVLRAMAKDPDKRWPTLDAFVTALRDPAAQALRERTGRLLSRPAVTIGIPLAVAAILGLLLFLTLQDGDDGDDIVETPITGEAEDG